MKTKPGTVKGRAVFSGWTQGAARWAARDDGGSDSRIRVHRIVAGAGTVMLVGISLFFAEWGSTYRWSFAFLAPLLWTAYWLRNRVALLPSHFALFVLAILLHDLGTFGFYEKSFLGLRFDTYVHFFFGLVAGLIAYRALREKLSLGRGTAWWLAPLLVLGLGGIHELIEWFSTILLGPERGMLKLRSDEPFDTQIDLLNNLLGALLAAACCSIRSRVGAHKCHQLQAKPET